MQQDILARITTDFDRPDHALAALGAFCDSAADSVSDRLLRCIVFLARGDTAKLNHFIELARTDYRDLIWQAEYDPPDTRRYNFNNRFDQQTTDY